jgi:hypothetical protein
LLSGCVAIPKSTDDFRKPGHANFSVCSESSVEDTAARIAEQMSSCYTHSNTDIPYTSIHTYIEVDEVSEAHWEIALAQKANWNSYYLQLVEVTESEDCPALVTSYGMTGKANWQKRAELVVDWVVGDNLDICNK